MTDELILEKVHQLSDDLKKEVLDFADYLVSKYHGQLERDAISETTSEKEEKKFWLNATSDALKEIWSNDDAWDEIYKKHKENSRTQAV